MSMIKFCPRSIFGIGFVYQKINLLTLHSINTVQRFLISRFLLKKNR